MSDEVNNDVLAKWMELKKLVEDAESDVLKNARGTVAAGARARKGLRALKAQCQSLVKLTVTLDKARKQERHVAKASKEASATA